MKHNALILTAALLLHTVVYAGNPSALIKNASKSPSATGLQTLCQQLQGQPLEDLSASSAGTQFADAYGRPLTQACSAAAMAELNALIATAAPFAPTAGGPASLADAENFTNAMENYIAAGGSTELYQNEFVQAKTVIATSAAAAATRGAATNRVEAEVEALAGNFADPAPGAVGTYGGGDSAYNLQVVTTFRNSIPRLSVASGLGTMTETPQAWLGELQVQLQNYNDTITNANWTLNGYAYVPANTLRQNVDAALVQAQGQITAAAAAGGGGGAGVCDAAVTTLAGKFATPGDVPSTIARIDRFFQDFQDNNVILPQLNTRTLDASCTFVYNVATGNPALVLADQQKTSLSNYLQSCVPVTPPTAPGPDNVPGFTFNPATELNNVDSLTTAVRRLRTAVDTNARGGGAAPVPAAPSAAELTAFNNTVAAHNAAIGALTIDGTRNFFTIAGATGAPQTFLGKNYSASVTQITDATTFTPSLCIIYTGLAANAANLYKTQQRLSAATTATGATAPVFAGQIQTLVRGNGATPAAPVAPDVNNPTAFTSADIVAPTTTAGAFTAGTFNVFTVNYPTT